MSSRSLDDLTPSLKEKALLLEEKAKGAGLDFIITCTARSILEQLALYAQGRMPLRYVNLLRSEAGLWLLNGTTNARKITWTLKSRHIADIIKGEKARAFDVALKNKEGKIHWNLKVDTQDDEVPDYEQLGAIGESIGLEWGGNWKVKDYPHFQEKRHA